MGYYIRLVHGSRYIDLTTAPYAPDTSFVPPETSTAVQMSTGSMRNKSGGREVSRKPRDRNYNLPLRISGKSASQTHGAVSRLTNFINSSLDDSSEKLYLVYGPSDAVPYEPLYGQLFYRYEVKSFSDAGIDRYYNVAANRAKTFFITLPLIIAPYAEGNRQLLGSATGGILEDTDGTADGSSRGLIIPEVLAANMYTNPVYGNSTYDTNFTASDATLVATQNTDKEFVFAGKNSALLVNTDTSNNRSWGETLTLAAATSYTISFRAKRQDSAAITSADCSVWALAAEQASTYTSLGNGWYRVDATVVGDAAARRTGAIIKAGRHVYIDGHQCEAKTYPTPLCYGDLLGNAWAGTAHASTSARTAARWRIPISGRLNNAEGSISFVWRAPIVYWRYTDRVIFTDGSGFQLAFINATDAFSFTDGTNTVTSAAKTFAAGQIYHIVCTWSSGGIALYINGVLEDSDVYTPPTFGTYFYLGSNSAAGAQMNGTFSDLTFFGVNLTTAEILAYYTDLAAHLSGGDGLGQVQHPIPWACFNQGDDILDNDYDTGTSLYNHFYAGGIPGNVPAETEWHILVDDINFATDQAMYFFNQPLKYEHIDNTNNLGVFKGAPATAGFTTTDTYFQTPDIYDIEQHNRQYYAWIRCIDSDSTYLRARLRVRYQGAGLNWYYTKYFPIPAHASTYKAFVIGPIGSGLPEMTPDVILSSTEIAPAFSRTAGGAETITISSLAILPDPTRIYYPNAMTGNYFVVKNGVTNVKTTANTLWDKAETSPPIQEMHPGRANFVMQFIGNTGIANVTTRTATWTVYVTPRWELL